MIREFFAANGEEVIGWFVALAALFFAWRVVDAFVSPLLARRRARNRAREYSGRWRRWGR